MRLERGSVPPRAGLRERWQLSAGGSGGEGPSARAPVARYRCPVTAMRSRCSHPERHPPVLVVPALQLQPNGDAADLHNLRQNNPAMAFVREQWAGRVSGGVVEDWRAAAFMIRGTPSSAT